MITNCISKLNIWDIIEVCTVFHWWDWHVAKIHICTWTCGSQQLKALKPWYPFIFILASNGTKTAHRELPACAEPVPVFHHWVMLMHRESWRLLTYWGGKRVAQSIHGGLKTFEKPHNHLKSLFLPYTNCTTQRISLLWNIKSNRKFQFTNYLNWKKHYILM